jgi:hypothetical protein
MGVRALPTTLIMQGDQELGRKSGAMSKSELVDFIDSTA